MPHCIESFSLEHEDFANGACAGLTRNRYEGGAVVFISEVIATPRKRADGTITLPTLEELIDDTEDEARMAYAKMTETWRVASYEEVRADIFGEELPEATPEEVEAAHPGFYERHGKRQR